jgi:MFS family permease
LIVDNKRLKETFKAITDLKTTFRAFNYRNYRLWFSGQGVSLVGTWMQRIALGWLVYRLTNSAFLLGMVGFMGQIPILILTPFAGVFIDRWSRYQVVLLMQILAMVQAFILAFLVLKGSIQVWHIMVLSIILGVINAFDMPARQAFVVEMVDKKEDLGNAIALNSSMFNGARLIGPSVGGVLIAVVGEGLCFLINGITFLSVIVALFFMKLNPRKINKTKVNFFQELKLGFSYSYKFHPIRAILILLSVISILGMPYVVLMPIFAKEILKGGPNTLGFLMAGAGIGALVGALYLASKKTVLGLERIIPISTAIFGLGLILFSLSRSFWLSMVIILFIGFGMMVQMASSNTVIQTIVDEDKRGRVMSIYATAFMGTVPFGSLLAGAVAAKIGAPYTILLSGIFCVIGAVLFARELPELRKLVNPIYIKMGIIPEVASGIQTASRLSTPPED